MPLTNDKIQVKELKGFNDFDVKATTKIYEGALVGQDSTDTYKVRGLVAGDKAVGFAVDRADNTVTGDAPSVHVQTEGRIKLAVAGSAAGDFSRAVFASDDGTFTYTSAGNSYVGRVCRYVSAGVVMVAFNFDANSPGYSDAFTGLYVQDINSKIAGTGTTSYNTLLQPNATYNATEMIKNFHAVNLQLNALRAMIAGTASA